MNLKPVVRTERIGQFGAMHREFEVDPKLIYLNSGTHSRCPKTVVEAWVRQLRDYEHNPTRNLFQAWGRIWEAQKQLAEFFDANPHDLFLRSNVTAVLNAFILGIEIPEPGGEIVVSDLEYGAITNLCRFRAEGDGRRLRAIHLPSSASELSGLTEESLAEQVISQLRPDTRLLVLSHIMTGNGLRLPIEKIAKETRRRGILFACDGAHGPGALPLRFSELSDLDFYGGNLHKWMMGPKGTSFGWVHPQVKSRLRSIQAGWTTFELPAPFAGFGEGDLFQGRMLLSGCIDFSPHLAIPEMIAFWNRIGSENIGSRLRELQRHIIREVDRGLKWPLLSPREENLRGPLVTFQLPPEASAEEFGLMFRLERDHGLQIAVTLIQGKFCLRFSPHIYNNEEEITRAVEILARELS